MKNYTQALVNTGKPKMSFKVFVFGSSAAKNHYYCARHTSEEIFIMWIECSRLGIYHCYPCVLEEQGDPLVYFTGKLNAKQNAMLVQRWKLFCLPESFADDYEVVEMEARDFNAKYNEYKTRDMNREIEEYEREKSGESAEPVQEDAQQDQDTPESGEN